MFRATCTRAACMRKYTKQPQRGNMYHPWSHSRRQATLQGPRASAHAPTQTLLRRRRAARPAQPCARTHAVQAADNTEGSNAAPQEQLTSTAGGRIPLQNPDRWEARVHVLAPARRSHRVRRRNVLLATCMPTHIQTHRSSALQDHHGHPRYSTMAHRVMWSWRRTRVRAPRVDAPACTDASPCARRFTWPAPQKAQDGHVTWGAETRWH